MRILNRPMFRYGGPIKEGVMHGMKNGGSMRETQQWNTVGSPVFPKDNSGRAKHLLPAAAIMAGLANLYRGYKAARYIAPHAATMGQKIKSALLPTSRFMKMGPSKMFRTGAAIKQNPMLAFTAASAVPQATVAGYKGAKEIPGGLWSGAKRWAAAVVPGDQSHWYKDKEPPKGIMKPGGYPGPTVPDIPEPKKISPEELAAKSKSERKARLARYLDEMGYDKAKKTAIGDALIDASAIVQQGTEEGGSLKHADWGKMINQAIQTTSKRLDKPEQIREAVGLMLTKAGIDKEFREDDAFTKKWKALNLDDPKNYAAWKKQQLGTPTFMENVAIANKAGATGQSMYDQAAKMTPDVNFRGNIINKSDFKEILEKQKKATGLDDVTIVETYTQGLLDQYPENFNDGEYTVGENLVTIKDNKIINVR